MNPHLYRTHDGGKTWTEIDNGIAAGAATSTIREDPKQKGLLFAGSETQVYVSFDDGDHWQSLRLNMPPSSVRDVQVKGDDLVAGTHGRGFLILDDITPLRQMSARVAQSPAYLFAPQVALRIRGDMNPPTPWVPEMGTGENPPDGAILDYYLGANAQGPVAIEIVDGAGKVVRRYASTDPVPPPDPMLAVPRYWPAPPQVVSTEAGEHRFIWDLHYAPVKGVSTGLDADQAVPHKTPPAPTSPWVVPGNYTVRLTVDGKSYTQPLVVKLDPRVKVSQADLEAQLRLAMQMYGDAGRASTALDQVAALREQIKQQQATGAAAEALAAFDKQLEAVAAKQEFQRFGPQGPPTLMGVRGAMVRLQRELENADTAPPAQMQAAYEASAKPLAGLLQQWETLKGKPLADVNAQLKAAGLKELDPMAKADGKKEEMELEVE